MIGFSQQDLTDGREQSVWRIDREVDRPAGRNPVAGASGCAGSKRVAPFANAPPAVLLPYSSSEPLLSDSNAPSMQISFVSGFASEIGLRNAPTSAPKLRSPEWDCSLPQLPERQNVNHSRIHGYTESSAARARVNFNGR